MSSDEVPIVVEALSKRYFKGRHRRTRITERSGHRAHAERAEVLWALKDLSFEVRRGSILGFIGSNGAGKSTLLRILASITPPTEGYARIIGHTASLLEVGTGFHPELTGRENVYLSSAIHGIGRTTTRKRLNDIVEFAGVGSFLDTPVKRYSSGMYVRLGFAVAAHLEPDVLLIDEVLAVGDAAFRERCLGHLDEAKSLGRTIVIVSHDMGTVRRLATRLIWLDQGRIRKDGQASAVVDAYLDRVFDVRSSVRPSVHPRSNPRVTSTEIRQVGGPPTGAITSDKGIQALVDIQLDQPISGLSVQLRLRKKDGTLALVTNSNENGLLAWFGERVGSHRLLFELPANSLAGGYYSVSVISISSIEGVLAEYPNLLGFQLIDSSDGGGSGREGAIGQLGRWESIG